MIISEIAKPITAEILNENLAKKFGQRIDLNQFTLEQLQDTRNKIRTTLSQVETNESFDAVKSESYQKSKMYLDVLNQAIKEREHIAEAEKCTDCKCSPCECETNESAKPDFLDVDKDGDKKEPMKKAAKDAGKGKGSKPKKGKVPPQFQKKNESVVREGAEDSAELVMAAKDMVDRVTGWMEDTAEMQTESMLELADAIRDEMGSEQSESFVNAVKPALESMYTAMESTRQSLTAGVGIVTGEGDPMDTMGTDDGMDMDMEPTTDMDDMAGDDEMDMDLDVDAGDDFGADAAAAGGEEEAGRAKRESVQRSKKK